MAENINPVDAHIKMKKVTQSRYDESLRKDVEFTYYIGNADIPIDMKDTVIKMEIPDSNDRHTSMVIKKYIPKEEGDHNYDNKRR